jgi:hypothetical protein
MENGRNTYGYKLTDDRNLKASGSGVECDARG